MKNHNTNIFQFSHKKMCFKDVLVSIFYISCMKSGKTSYLQRIIHNLIRTLICLSCKPINSDDSTITDFFMVTVNRNSAASLHVGV